MLMKILLIGNSGIKTKDKGGQTAKLRLYKKKMEDEGVDVLFVDLEHFFRKAFSTFFKIKKLIKECDRIVLVSGHRACRLFIPFINRINKNRHIPFILPLVGTGVLHYSIDHLNDEEKNRFFCNHEYCLGKHFKKIEIELRKVTFILPETELLKSIYSEFYHLDNCLVLNNFREINDFESKAHKSFNSTFRLVFLSRIIESKGIFDLLECISHINGDFCLDIFGKKGLSKQQGRHFNSYLTNKVRYCGVIDNDSVIRKLNDYDLFVFPTRYLGEGTPGVIAESLIAGTPILCSSFPQSNYLLKNGYDSIFYTFLDVADLKEKLLYCLENKTKLTQMRGNAIKSGQKFLYNHERNIFLKYVCGKQS